MASKYASSALMLLVRWQVWHQLMDNNDQDEDGIDDDDDDEDDNNFIHFKATNQQLTKYKSGPPLPLSQITITTSTCTH